MGRLIDDYIMSAMTDCVDAGHAKLWSIRLHSGWVPISNLDSLGLASVLLLIREDSNTGNIYTWGVEAFVRM